ncbi:aminoglycoside N(3)-acetyltransferase [Streptomyces sp. NBC_00316]|uniref:aminoglycoside N(3)-acetyltransferase n=1 Tax=Streptomyces sp. NBC_00316 TaxID=2975710 RepID=UPI002E295B5D|nr:AAC(3) family N-acetyltransferase [Streptomyces sp. NBC_00316]
MLHPAATPETPGPYSRNDLLDGLRTSGVRAGDTLMVHAAISSVGWTTGGGVALVQALRDAVGTTGTLVVPAFTTYLTDPATWVQRPVPRDWWPTVREAMIAFDPDLHPAQPPLGRLPELVRSLPGARRSAHPLYSFAAAGPRADAVLARHALPFGMGSHSPLAALCRGDAKVLMIGVGWDRCTVLHLSEHLTAYPGRRSHRMDIPRSTPSGPTRWEPSRQLVMYEGDYGAIGTEATRCGLAVRGHIGAARTLLAPAADLVDLGCTWLARNRDLSGWRVAANMTGVSEAPAGAL